ncbi:MAG: DUF6434 domain-containing protein [Pseudomonadota bacterium]
MTAKPDTRPDIASITTGKELRRWYWLKAELEAQAKAVGLSYAGRKFDILDRLAHFLDTGERQAAGAGKANPKSKSSFDWHSEPLTPETIITDSYKNSQNVRRFFRSQIGDGFKFNIEFMAWMRTNIGQTLADACVEYTAMREREKAPGFKSKIARDNQFNQYTRDFLADHPDRPISDVRKYWKLKRALPSEDGRHVYEPSDLDLT